MNGDPGAIELVLRTEGGSLVTDALSQVQTLFLLFSYPVISHLHLQNIVNIIVVPLSPVGMAAAAAVFWHTRISAFFPSINTECAPSEHVSPIWMMECSEGQPRGAESG